MSGISKLALLVICYEDEIVSTLVFHHENYAVLLDHFRREKDNPLVSFALERLEARAVDLAFDA